MKTKVLFLSIALFSWIGLSTYYYVCKIKKLCPHEKTEIAHSNKKEIQIIPEEIKLTHKKEAVNETDSGANIDSTKIKNENLKVEINKVKKILQTGYSVYNFPNGKTSIKTFKPEFHEFVKQLISFKEKTGITKIFITGYTDNTGNDKINKRLGRQRAEFVKKTLQAKGLKNIEYVVASKGADSPIASNNSDSGKLKNRRVLITIQ